MEKKSIAKTCIKYMIPLETKDGENSSQTEQEQIN